MSQSNQEVKSKVPFKSHWFATPNEVFDIPCNTLTKLVLIYLLGWQRCQLRGDTIFVSQKRIAKECGCSERAVRYCLTWLEQERYITTKSHQINGKSNTYEIVFERFETAMKTATENRIEKLTDKAQKAQIHVRVATREIKDKSLARVS